MARYRIFKFKHPKTNKIFSELRNVENANDEFKAPDGVICKSYGNNESNFKSGVIVNGKEGFERYPGYYKEMNPKKVRYRDGHAESYDPTKHC